MFKCLINFCNLKSQSQLILNKQNYFNFSKKFFEKRKKIKGFLSKEKEKYKIEMLNREYESKNLKEADEKFTKGKKKEMKFSTEQNQMRKLKKINNIINSKSATIGKNYSYLFYNKHLKSFLAENYNILPGFISNKIIHQFTEELKLNKVYKNYFADWINKNEHEKNEIIEEENLSFTEFELAEYNYFKPIIDLFVYFIKCKYEKDLESLKFLSNLSDMTMPQNWFPQARSKKRVIYYHLGPTNSGKTNQAIQSLMKAKTGIYCAPLRLLAWEIQEKLLSSNIKCTLKTGQESVEVDNATHFSCTIEICPTTTHYDVAVIDEIQLIADPHRGFAWTTAFLGLIADEIHLCGDERALNLIYNLCELTGDTLIKKSYTRLSDLVVEDNNVHSVSQLQKGDCIVAFSKKDIFKLKNLINEKSYKPHDIQGNDEEDADDDLGRKGFLKNKCAVIYGSLPPETKKLQAVMFNNFENGIKYLVATDAIGMGLNLNIKRIIFASTGKRDSKGHRKLTEFEVRQIAGRAGRSKNTGYVSAFKKSDLEFVRSCCSKAKHKKTKRKINEEIVYTTANEYKNDFPKFEQNETLIEKACLFPPLQTIIDFSEAILKFNKTTKKKSDKNKPETKSEHDSYISLASTLRKFELLTKISELYFINDLEEYYEKHKIIEKIKDADLRTQYYFTICPIKVTPRTTQYLTFFLTQLVKFQLVKLPQSFHLENKLFTKNSYRMNELTTFEEIYNTLEVYVWLSYKFEKEFIERELAKVLKERVSRIIESIIHHSRFNVYSDLRNENGKDLSESEDDNEFTNPGNKERMMLPEDSNLFDVIIEDDKQI